MPETILDYRLPLTTANDVLIRDTFEQPLIASKKYKLSFNPKIMVPDLNAT